MAWQLFCWNRRGLSSRLTTSIAVVRIPGSWHISAQRKPSVTHRGILISSQHGQAYSSRFTERHQDTGPPLLGFFATISRPVRNACFAVRRFYNFWVAVKNTLDPRSKVPGSLDTKIILIKSNVFVVAAEPLRQAGFTVLNQELLDYPGHFNQRAYREKLSKLAAQID